MPMNHKVNSDETIYNDNIMKAIKNKYEEEET